MDSIFTKIIDGTIPSYKIAEDDNFIAFLDAFPIAKGHLLVVPKKQVDYIFDLDSETYTNLWKFTKQMAKQLEKAIDCERIGIAVIGLEVPHAHIHLVPLNHVGDINFSKPKLSLKKEEMVEICERIKSH